MTNKLDIVHKNTVPVRFTYKYLVRGGQDWDPMSSHKRF